MGSGLGVVKLVRRQVILGGGLAAVVEPLKLLNVFLLSMGLFQVFLVNLTPVAAGALGPDHWRTEQRRLVVVDKTNDPGWQQATRHAVNAWNRVAGPDGPHLSWTAASGTCLPDGVRVSVCTTSAWNLGGGPSSGRQGLAELDLDRTGHNGGAYVLVCGDCDAGAARQRVIATHEIGHILGLSHTRRPTSVMLHTGGGEEPDVQDAAQLRSIYEHADRPVRCGVFNISLGAFCL